MKHNHLWTPWRMTYIRRGQKNEHQGCVFCDREHPVPGEEDIIARGQYAYVMLNRFPYTAGHVMVLPYAHVPTPEAVPIETLTEIMQLINHTMAALRQAYNPAGFNIGANIGSAAGAGLAAHLHYHVVPRWNGDSNFMLIVGGTQVVPDDLQGIYRTLKPAWEATIP